MIELDNGTYISPFDIASIERIDASKGVSKIAIKTKSGRTFVTIGSADYTAKSLEPVIPAAPGYFLLEALEPDTCSPDWGHVKTPVVAWRITMDGARPITCEYNASMSSNHWAILNPDGSLIAPDDGLYPGSVDGWLEILGALERDNKNASEKSQKLHIMCNFAVPSQSSQS